MGELQTSKTTSDARGYAIVDRHGKILPRTVAPELRGAIVNWLYVYAHVRVLANWPDDIIRDRFDHIKDQHGVRATEIIISEIK